MPDFLSIPGNIRQQYMPFTISGPGKRQVFSFKDVIKKGYPNARQIHPFSKWAETLILNDSSIQYTHGPKGGQKVKFDEFLDEIPALQIREYVPDAKLTQTFKWFSYFKKGFDAGLQNIDSKAFSFTGLKEEVSKIMDKIGKTMKDLTSGSAPLLQQVVAGLAHLYQDKGYNIGEDNGFAVLFLPFILYYRLTTTHTNNVYEIPYSMQNEIMKSDGTYGWNGGNQSDFGLMDKAIAAVGESPITKLLLGNTVKVNMMPSFQPTGEARGESFTINIDLINDSDEAAINNFLMCHTLFGNNRWLQYGFVQAGASLYDVKLPGANRYFMCSGQFSCKGKGAFRTPSTEVCKKIKDCANPIKTFAKEIQSGGSLSDVGEKMKQERAQTMVNQQLSDIASSSTPFGITKRKIRRDAGDDAWKAQQAAAMAEYQLQTGLAASKSTTGIQTVQKNQFSVVAPEPPPPLTFAQQKEAFRQASIEYTKSVDKVDTLNDTISKSNYNIDDANRKIANADKIINDPSSTSQERSAAEAVKKEAQTELSEAENKKQAAESELPVAESEMSAAKENMEQAKEPVEKELMSTAKMQSSIEVETYAKTATVTPEDIKKLIKIPDVYSLTLTFNSLLPDNFNNYLYGFRAGNLDPIENYAKGTVDEIGVFEKLVQQLEAALK